MITMINFTVCSQPISAIRQLVSDQLRPEDLNGLTLINIGILLVMILITTLFYIYAVYKVKTYRMLDQLLPKRNRMIFSCISLLCVLIACLLMYVSQRYTQTVWLVDQYSIFFIVLYMIQLLTLLSTIRRIHMEKEVRISYEIEYEGEYTKNITL